MNNTFITRRVSAHTGDIDPATYLRSIRAEILGTLQNGMKLHGSVRWVLSLTVVFERLLDGNEQEII